MELKAWEYQVGGYQVLDKWLKDRKKRILSTEDIKHYCRVVTALVKTIQLQAELDQLYPEVEKHIIGHALAGVKGVTGVEHLKIHRWTSGAQTCGRG